MYVNSVSDVVATEGDIDADLGAELPAQLDGDVGLDSTMAVSLPLHGHEDEQSTWQRNAWTLELQTQFSREADIVLAQDAVFVCYGQVFHGRGHENGDG